MAWGDILNAVLCLQLEPEGLDWGLLAGRLAPAPGRPGHTHPPAHAWRLAPIIRSTLLRAESRAAPSAGPHGGWRRAHRSTPRLDVGPASEAAGGSPGRVSARQRPMRTVALAQQARPDPPEAVTLPWRSIRNQATSAARWRPTSRPEVEARARFALGRRRPATPLRQAFAPAQLQPSHGDRSPSSPVASACQRWWGSR